jgi:hypothetical protein
MVSPPFCQRASGCASAHTRCKGLPLVRVWLYSIHSDAARRPTEQRLWSYKRMFEPGGDLFRSGIF